MSGWTHEDDDGLHVIRPIPRSEVLSDVGHGRVMMILKEHRLEMEEVIETIHDNINQLRTDLDICLPELKGILYGQMAEYFHDIESLADMLGKDHPMIRTLEQEGNQLISSVNETMYLANTILRDAVSNWDGYTDTVCDDDPEDTVNLRPTAETQGPQDVATTTSTSAGHGTTAQLAGDTMAGAVTVSTPAGHCTTAQVAGKHSTMYDEEMQVPTGQEQSDGSPAVLEVADDPELVDDNPGDIPTNKVDVVNHANMAVCKGFRTYQWEHLPADEAIMIRDDHDHHRVEHMQADRAMLSMEDTDQSMVVDLPSDMARKSTQPSADTKAFSDKMRWGPQPKVSLTSLQVNDIIDEAIDTAHYLPLGKADQSLVEHLPADEAIMTRDDPDHQTVEHMQADRAMLSMEDTDDSLMVNLPSDMARMSKADDTPAAQTPDETGAVHVVTHKNRIETATKSYVKGLSSISWKLLLTAF